MSAFGNGKVVPLRGARRDEAPRLMPLWSGFRIRNCRIEGLLSRSRVAITYHGRDLLLGRPVLIKECAPGGLVRRARDGSLQRLERADAGVHRAIVREFAARARTLASCEHPRLARAHSLFTHRDGAYLIMQDQCGLRLDQHVRHLAPLSPAAVEKMLRSLLGALDYLHARDLVHRGVRPSHVRLAEDGGAMLLDFGLALNVAGTPAGNDLTRYSAPEAFAGQPDGAGPASDLYSLAATLYFALSGRHPPAPSHRVKRLRASGMDPMQVLLRGATKQCPPGLARALSASLSLAPSDRPAGVAEWRDLVEVRQPPARPKVPGAAAAIVPNKTAPAPRRLSGLRRMALTGAVGSALATLLWWGGIQLMPGATPPPAVPVAAPDTPAGGDVQAVRQRLIERLMGAAELDIREQRLARPPGNNAHEKLVRVLELAPAHQRARQRLDGIVDRFLALARDARARGDLEAADDFVNRAEAVAPDQAGVVAERRSLTDARRTRAKAVAPAGEPGSATATAARRPVVAPQPKPAVAPQPKPAVAPQPKPAVAPQPKPAVAADTGEGETIRIESASFMMGSTPDEPDRGADERLHLVSVPSYALGRHEVTVAEFRRFVEATGYVTDAERDAGGWPGCLVFNGGGQWEFKAGTNWRQPGFPQGPQHPVVCVSLSDASAYAHWRSEESGLPYRLPTEAEWEYAARRHGAWAGARGEASEAPVCRFANAADRSMQRALNDPSRTAQACDDGSAYTAAVGSLERGARGLSDMLGNVWEWTCSDYAGDYGGAERRCADPFSGAQKAVRGGGWSDPPAQVRIANRGRLPAEYRYANLGFRIALDAR